MESQDAPRCTYSIRNAAFAEAFSALNLERFWNPHSPAAKRAAHSRKIVIGVVIAIVMALILWDVAHGVLGH